MRRPLLSALALVAALSAAPALAVTASSPYTSLWVFGDSLSDAGNLYNLTAGGLPPSPYWQGRYSNGPTYAEDLATLLNPEFAATPSRLRGNNFAYAGATASSVTGTVPGIEAQVTTFRDRDGAADPHGLYVLWAGANDMLNNPTQDGIDKAMNGLQGAIRGLYDEGARDFLVMNLPNLGLTPKVTKSIEPGAVLAAKQVSEYFNAFFVSTITELRGALDESNIRTLDTFTLLKDVVDNKDTYGLSNVTASCFNPEAEVVVCTDPSSYLFWDGIHPTEAGHAIIANAAYGVLAVPEPETYAMFLAGLGILAVAARRRRGA